MKLIRPKKKITRRQFLGQTAMATGILVVAGALGAGDAHARKKARRKKAGRKKTTRKKARRKKKV